MNKIQNYYAAPGLMTTPGKHAALFDALPDEIPAIVQIVQGLMIHVFWAERYGLPKAEIREDEVNIRRTNQMLTRILELDERPLSAARPKERKLVGNCRDFSTLTTAILRHKGIPARARCGFGLYFIPDHFEDHWVIETWDAAAQRWVMLDAQLDSLQQEAMNIQFNTLDMPARQFWTGGRAWLACRAGEEDPEKFGIFDMKGLWFIRGNLVRDVAALNKLEGLPWDVWGLIEKKDEELTENDMALLDQAARLSLAGDESFEDIRTLYDTRPELHPGTDWLAAV